MNNRGVFNRVFVDFWEYFVVNVSRDGGECKEVRIESATFDGKRFACKCFSGKRYNLESVDVILFRSCPDAVCKITVMSLFEFAIDCEVPLLSIPPGDMAVQVKNSTGFPPQTVLRSKVRNAGIRLNVTIQKVN